MKSKIRNIIIALLVIAAFVTAMWLLPARAIIGIIILLQVLTILVLGGIYLNTESGRGNGKG